jgi:alkylhydroperoxidase family enzyme
MARPPLGDVRLCRQATPSDSMQIVEPATPAIRVPPALHPSPSARVVAKIAGLVTGTEAPRVFTTVARHRRLCRWWLPFAGTLLVRGRLPKADAELVVLRTAWNCGCWYEWVQHATLAARAGLDRPAIDALAADDLASHPWTARQRLLLDVVDELHAERVITDRTWDRLQAEMGDEDALELCFLVGHYEMLAMVLNSLGVEAEPGARRKLTGPSAAVADQLCRSLDSRRRR